jgi:serine/threonine-protein kinase HipA
MRSTIETYQNGHWIPAAEFDPIGKGPYTATFEYRMDYVFGDNPLPVSFALPVAADRLGLNEDGEAPPCPAFLLDLVPQGRGRKYLAQELKLDDGEHRDLLLAQYGAFNPIGNLRLDTAVRFYQERAAQQTSEEEQGFTLKEILARKEEFLEHIWIHAMLTAGTTGVQGAAPKFLMTQNAEGLWFADAALPDDKAARHWLVKLPRGGHETDYTVLRNEAAYLHVAKRCGIRTGGEPQFHKDMLFVQRFDRVVDQAGPHHLLHRLHQESLASLAGIQGFGLPTSLFDLAEAFRRHVADPVGETVEFIKRDILNMAMRNTDNHARNTAVQRLPNGTVQLTPVFDFAPMYMDREFITRGCKWRIDNGPELADWEEIIQKLSFHDAEKQTIAEKIKAFQPVIELLAETMQDCGVEPVIIDSCKANIETQAARLERLALP